MPDPSPEVFVYSHGKWVSISSAGGGGTVADIKAGPRITVTDDGAGTFTISADVVDYADITGKPTIPTKVSELTNDLNFVDAATAKANAPVQTVVAGTNGIVVTDNGSGRFIINGPPPVTSIAWGDVTGKPTLFSGSYNDLTDKPTIFSGAYADLTGKPTLFSGSYNDLTDRPAIPTVAVKGLLAGTNVTLSESNGVFTISAAGGGTSTSVQADWSATSGSSAILNKPTLATVATSGSYNDLADTPTLPTGLPSGMKASQIIQATNPADPTTTPVTAAWVDSPFAPIDSPTFTTKVTVPASKDPTHASLLFGASGFGFANGGGFGITYLSLLNGVNPVLQSSTGASSATSIFAPGKPESQVALNASSITIGTHTKAVVERVPVIINGIGLPLDKGTKGQVLRVKDTPNTHYSEMEWHTPTTGGVQSIIAGTNVTVSDDGAGNITIGSTGGGGSGTTTVVQSDWNATSGDSAILNKPTLATVATSGAYADLTGLPTIPTVVKPDWSALAGAAAEILNKPALATVATTGSYADLTNKPTIPAAQVQSDWNATTGLGVIKNKPTIPAAQVQPDWNATTGMGAIKNKPTIPAAQVQSDWTATTGLGAIKNKPTLFSGAYADLTGTPTLPTKTSELTNDSGFLTAAPVTDIQAGSNITISKTGTVFTITGTGGGGGTTTTIQADWNAASGDSAILNKPTLHAVATSGKYTDLTGRPTLHAVATSGSYADLTNKPTIPAAQVAADWTATTGVTRILNKPTLSTVATSGSYADLTNKPTIPTVTKPDWNAAAGTAAEILHKPTIPTKTSELTNDSNFLTTAVKAITEGTGIKITDSGGGSFKIDSAVSFTCSDGSTIKGVDTIEDLFQLWAGCAKDQPIDPVTGRPLKGTDAMSAALDIENARMSLDYDLALAGGLTVELPFKSGIIPLKLTIDWGDDTAPEEVTATPVTHTYAATGKYNIKITGTAESFGLGNSYSATKPSGWAGFTGLRSWGSLGLRNVDGAFHSTDNFNCDVPPPPTTAQSAKRMFQGVKVFNRPLIWDEYPLAIQDMSFFMTSAQKMKSDIRIWAPYCTTLTAAFAANPAFDAQVELNIPACTSIEGMFTQCTVLNSRAKIFAPKCTAISSLYAECPLFNQPVDDIVVGTIEQAGNVFKNCASFNRPISHWDFSECLNINSILEGCTRFNFPLDSWDLRKAEVSTTAFKNCTSLCQPLSNIRLWASGMKSQTSIRHFFVGCTGFRPSQVDGLLASFLEDKDHYISTTFFEMQVPCTIAVGDPIVAKLRAHGWHITLPPSV